MSLTTKIALEKKIEKGAACIQRIKEQSENAFAHNEALLLKLLEENKDTDYGKKYGFQDIKSAKEYQKAVPLTVYKDYEPFIDEIIQGKEQVLSARPVHHYAKSSGSVGIPKRVPMCLEAAEMFTDYTLNVCFASMNEVLGSAWEKSRGVSLACVQFESINGISYGAVSGKVREKYKDVEHYIYTSPLAATYPTGDTDIKYLHWRYALMEADLSFITCSFLNLAVDGMRYLEHQWPLLVKDIAEGVIDESIKIPAREREKLMASLVPMPQRAKELEEEFKRGFDGILTRIWTDFQFIYGIGEGGFRVYKKKMRKYLGGAKIHLGIYSASEGIFATHLKPESKDMVLILDSAFYEFIDIEDISRTPLTIEQVEKGKAYEIIITNLSGFYRYQIQDVIRVTGFMGSCPLIRFLYRKNQMIDMAGEKTNDDCMNTAISFFCDKAELELVEYCVYADYNYAPGRYVVFIEVESNRKREELSALEALLDKELCRVNPSYADKIRRGVLSSVKIHFLRENTFAVYRQLMIAKGGSVTQIKPVRVIDNPFRERFFFSMTEETVSMNEGEGV